MKFITAALLGLLIYLPAQAESTKNFEVNVQNSETEILGNKYYTYHFGNVFLNSSTYADISIRNTGNGNLRIVGIYISGPSFHAWSNCPGYLSPGQRCAARVEFSPWYDGYHHGQLQFRFPQDSIIVDLYGNGINY